MLRSTIIKLSFIIKRIEYILNLPNLISPHHFIFCLYLYQTSFIFNQDVLLKLLKFWIVNCYEWAKKTQGFKGWMIIKFNYRLNLHNQNFNSNVPATNNFACFNLLAYHQNQLLLEPGRLNASGRQRKWVWDKPWKMIFPFWKIKKRAS